MMILWLPVGQLRADFGVIIDDWMRLSSFFSLNRRNVVLHLSIHLFYSFIMIAEQDKFDTMVLGGGGMRALVLIGAMQYMEDARRSKFVKRVYGTSMGSIIGSLFAIRITASQMKLIIPELTSLNMLSFSLLNINRGGLSGSDNFESTYKKWLRMFVGYDDITLSEVREFFGVDFHSVCFDNNTDAVLIFNADSHPNVQLWEAVYSSVAMPLIFVPHRYLYHDLIDGGVVYNFGLPEAPGEKTIGFHIPPRCQDVHEAQDMLSKFLVHYQLMTMRANKAEFANRLGGREIEATVVDLDNSISSAFDIRASASLLEETLKLGYNNTMNVLTGLVSKEDQLKSISYLTSPSPSHRKEE